MDNLEWLRRCLGDGGIVRGLESLGRKMGSLHQSMGYNKRGMVAGCTMGWIGQQDNQWVIRRIDLSADSRWDVKGDGRWNDLVAGTRRVEFRVQTVAGTRYGTDKVISRRTLDRWNMTWGTLGAEGRWDTT